MATLLQPLIQGTASPQNWRGAWRSSLRKAGHRALLRSRAPQCGSVWAWRKHPRTGLQRRYGGGIAVEFGILGPLTAVGPDGPVALNAAKHRALLAMLLLVAARSVVPADRLIDAVWGDEPPASAHEGAAGLRLAGAARARRRPADRHPPARLRRRARARRAGSRALRGAHRAGPRRPRSRRRRRGCCDEALALFRGPPLADAPLHGPAAAEADRLDGLRLAALEDRIDAELAARPPRRGRSASWRRSCAEHPYRERLHGQLMLALYRSGRQADALAAFRRARDTLVEELGIDPGPGAARAGGADPRPGPRARPRARAVRRLARSPPRRCSAARTTSRRPRPCSPSPASACSRSPARAGSASRGSRSSWPAATAAASSRWPPWTTPSASSPRSPRRSARWRPRTRRRSPRSPPRSAAHPGWSSSTTSSRCSTPAPELARLLAAVPA